MSVRNYSVNPNKPAFSMVEDEDITSAFLSSSGAPYLAADKLPMSSEERAINEAEQRRNELLQQMKQVEERTLESSKRSIGVLLESEKIGIETAEDISRQREQLENTDSRLDEINSNLKDTQKNINGIKSVFSSLRQWWGAPKGSAPKGKKCSSDEDESRLPKDETVKITANLSSAVEESQFSISTAHESHPSMRLRGFEEEDDIPTSLREFREHSKKVDKQLDQDLDSMSAGLTRLKGLAQGLGTEIQEQNELLDKIQTKADKADITVGSQTKQMNRILKR